MPKSRSLGLGNSKFQRPNRSSFRKFGETPWPQESKTELGPDFWRFPRHSTTIAFKDGWRWVAVAHCVERTWEEHPKAAIGVFLGERISTSLLWDNYTYIVYTYIQTARLTDGWTDGQTYRHTDITTYRHTDIPTHRHADTPTRRHTDTPTHRRTDVPTHRHTDIQTDRHTDIQTDIQTYRHASMHPCIHAYMHTCIHASMHPSIHPCMHPIHASMHPCIHACIYNITYHYITLHNIT